MPGGVLDSLPPEIQDAILGRTVKSLPPAASTQLGPSGSSGPVSNGYLTPKISLGEVSPESSNTLRPIIKNGQVVGTLEYGVNGDTLTIHQLKTNAGIQAVTDKVLGRNIDTSQQLSSSEMGDLARQLQQDHPEVKYIEATRVGGLRGAEGRSVKVPISKLAGRGAPLEPRIVGTRQGTRVSVPRSQLSDAIKDGFTPDQGQ